MGGPTVEGGEAPSALSVAHPQAAVEVVVCGEAEVLIRVLLHSIKHRELRGRPLNTTSRFRCLGVPAQMEKSTCPQAHRIPL